MNFKAFCWAIVMLLQLAAVSLIVAVFLKLVLFVAWLANYLISGWGVLAQISHLVVSLSLVLPFIIFVLDWSSTYFWVHYKRSYDKFVESLELKRNEASWKMPVVRQGGNQLQRKVLRLL